MFVHWDGSFNTYHSFFSYLAGRFIGDVGITELAVSEGLVFGSDEEKAVTRALEVCFPKSRRVLCTKHVTENLRHYLQDKIGMTTTERASLLMAIFDSDGGLIASESTENFDEMCITIAATVNNEQLSRYLEQQIFPALRRNVDAASNVQLTPMWTNNNCESANHILKQMVDWHPQKLPTLIDTLHDAAKLNMIHLRLALTGRGDCSLSQAYRRYQVHPHVWAAKSEEEKTATFQKFIKMRRPNRVAEKIVSTDGMLVIPNLPQAGKKPGQRKRTKACKTTSHKRMKTTYGH
jgi:hypothetical protein